MESGKEYEKEWPLMWEDQQGHPPKETVHRGNPRLNQVSWAQLRLPDPDLNETKRHPFKLMRHEKIGSRLC